MSGCDALFISHRPAAAVAASGGCATGGAAVGATDWRFGKRTPNRRCGDAGRPARRTTCGAGQGDAPRRRGEAPTSQLWIGSHDSLGERPGGRAQILRTLSYCNVSEAQLVVDGRSARQVESGSVAACEALGPARGSARRARAATLAGDADIDVRLAAAAVWEKSRIPSSSRRWLWLRTGTRPCNIVRCVRWRSRRASTSATTSRLGGFIVRAGRPSLRTESLAARMRRLF